jgi:hypothetical protein
VGEKEGRRERDGRTLRRSGGDGTRDRGGRRGHRSSRRQRCTCVSGRSSSISFTERRRKEADAPLEVEEEPPRLPNHPQLVHDRKEEEDSEDDDGDETSGLLLDIMRCEAVDGEPFE